LLSKAIAAKLQPFEPVNQKKAPIVANDVCFLMFFAHQAPKILSLTVFLKDSSDSLPKLLP
jgi:hypothetical protein